MAMHKRLLPLISVIIPAHNAVATIDRCLDSVLSQSYRELEIIVIVNACADATEKSAREFEAFDSRVRVIVTDQAGVSHARNIGLRLARGDYISFVDSDDWINQAMLESMVEAAVEFNADVITCGMYLDSPGGSVIVPVAGNIEKINPDDFYFGVLMGPYGGSVCNKIFSHKTIENSTFDESMAIIEDSAFCCALAADYRTFYAVPGSFYHYVSNQQSATHDITRLITSDGKWAYLEGAMRIQAAARSESQKRISEKVNSTFAASGVRKLAGKAEYKTLYKELRSYMWVHLVSYLKIESRGLLKVKTLIALFAPRVWRFFHNNKKVDVS